MNAAAPIIPITNNFLILIERYSDIKNLFLILLLIFSASSTKTVTTGKEKLFGKNQTRLVSDKTFGVMFLKI